MKRLVTFLLAAVLAAVAFPASAQDGGDLKCSNEDLSAAVQHIINTLSDSQTQDPQAQFQALIVAQETIGAINSMCVGIDFSGSSNKVYDPVYIPPGIYRMTATTPGYLILKGTILEGTCDEEFTYFNIFADRATNGAQIVFKSEGCLMVWQSGNVDTAFTVTFERLK